jgi:hypothetical protein
MRLLEGSQVFAIGSNPPITIGDSIFFYKSSIEKQ